MWNTNVHFALAQYCSGGSSNEKTQELQCDEKGDRRCEGEIANIIIFTI